MLHNQDKHDIISCPLCEASFVCLCNRATACPCNRVNLSPDETEWISWQTQGDCVCISCLLSLKQAARLALA
ncbi:cysteine-rich CWC family protein [Prosthecobacter sp. SYSU 5D2]|uniref:cysteine-rich CWC family protein n=1 Tax=Prosthecobacter sp. SYSU 5D2 TaxID=3134134 RepID=UPI0031FF3885